MFRPLATSPPPDPDPTQQAPAHPGHAAWPDDVGLRHDEPAAPAPAMSMVRRSWRGDPTIGKPRSSGVSLFSQVLAVNTLIIIATVFVASVAARLDIHTPEGLKSFLVAILAILMTALVNGWILRRRFRPLERLIHALEDVDLERPIVRSRPEAGEPADVAALRNAVERMLARLDLERRRRASAVIDAQESERARLARDLHDEVNQSLTGIMLRVSAIARDSNPGLRAALGEVRDLTEEAMAELLRLSHDLRPTALDDLGLPAALTARLSRLAHDTDLSVQSHIEADLPELDRDRQTVVFRIAQEAISNVVQHAAATTVALTLERCAGGGVRLRIADDGCGIGNRQAPTALGQRGHAGLTGMRERALLVGGTLDLRSSPAGTSVELVL